MENGTKVGRPTLVLAAVVAVVVAGVTLVISQPGGSSPEPGPPTTSAPPQEPEPVVQFGVWGTEAEIAAYRRVVRAYNETTETVEAQLQAWPDAETMLAEIDAGSASPDVFLLPRSELASTVENRRNRPLLDLVAARAVSLGDDYTRTALNAFTANDALQCMPFASSPMVIYYNTDLIDFAVLEEQGLPVPREGDGLWPLEAFQVAAQAATRPRQRTRGFYIEPTLEGLTPFLLSGGGQLFDDVDNPTSLALGEEGSVDALTEALEVLRDSTLTLTDQQLQRRTPEEWFRSGRLGMLAGYRDLVPRLRATKGLNFDVLPMPRLGGAATVGDLTGLCIADAAAPEAERAADFLVHLISPESVSEVVETGSVAPSHLQVAFSDAFLQPGQQPERASVFTLNQRHIALRPLIESWPALAEAANDGLASLLTATVLTREEIAQVLAGIDEESRPILDPDYEPSAELDSDDDSES